MRVLALAAVFTLAACQPGGSSRAVVELYMHPNGLSNCVVTEGDKWVADASCCPTGFSLAGFSAPSATAMERPIEKTENDTTTTEYKVTRRIYRHVVCLQDVAGPS